MTDLFLLHAPLWFRTNSFAVVKLPLVDPGLACFGESCGAPTPEDIFSLCWVKVRIVFKIPCSAEMLGVSGRVSSE
jgi:hypothetical protein